VLALSQPYEESEGTATGNWTAYLSEVTTLYLCGRQGQTYERLEAQTTKLLKPQQIDELLEKSWKQYEGRRPLCHEIEVTYNQR
jgi:hypothetical protein